MVLLVGLQLQLQGLGAGDSWKGGWMKVEQREVFNLFFNLILICSFWTLHSFSFQPLNVNTILT